MNPLVGESKNLLTAGKVLGPISDPSIYRSFQSDIYPKDIHPCERGDRNYVMGRSSLMEFYRCPNRWKNGYESEDSKATEWGSLVDCLFLTPEAFKNRYSIAPETYPDSKTGEPKAWNANSNWCKEWIAEQEGKEVIKHKFFGPACDAVKVLESDLEVKLLRECSQTQVMATASYHDEETGIVVPLRILIDLLPDVDSKFGKSLADFKTTNCAAMRPWAKHVFDFGYDMQAALYLDVWTANTGEDRVEFRHVVQESFAPYQTERRLLSVESLEIGRNRYKTALQKYCQCLATNAWPGYESQRDFDGWQSVELDKYPWMNQ